MNNVQVICVVVAIIAAYGIGYFLGCTDVIDAWRERNPRRKKGE